MKNKQSLNRQNKNRIIKEGDYIKADLVGYLVILAIFVFIGSGWYTIHSTQKIVSSSTKDLSMSIHNLNTTVVSLLTNQYAIDTMDKISKSVAMVIAKPLSQGEILTSDSIYVDSNGESWSKGTGFFISCDGYLITAYHVIENAIKDGKVNVILTGKQFPATIIRYRSEFDMAILKINANTTPVHIGSLDNIKRGQKVAFIGYPLSESQDLQITHEGIISFLGHYKHLGSQEAVPTFTINAFVNHGNSGGPVFIIDNGEVIGIIVEKEPPQRNKKVTPFMVEYSKLKQESQNNILDLIALSYLELDYKLDYNSQLGIGIVTALDNSILKILEIDKLQCD